MKRIISVLLVLVMTLCLLPATAVSADETPSITVDGDLSDWEGLATLSVIGSGEWEGKKVTFYGVLGEDGLYLAADAYHEKFVNNGPSWHESTNFEFFINKNGTNANQCWVSAQGMTDANTAPTKSHDKMVATMTSEKVGELNHTIVEVFMAYADFDFLTVTDDHLRVGIAWKTIGDLCNNGEAAGGGKDEYWVPKLTWPANADKAHVTENGIFDRNGEPAPCTHANTEIVNAKEATETEEGYTGDTKCKDCNETIATGTTIPVKTPTSVPSTGDALNVALVVSLIALVLSISLVFKKRTITE